MPRLELVRHLIRGGGRGSWWSYVVDRRAQAERPGRRAEPRESVRKGREQGATPGAIGRDVCGDECSSWVVVDRVGVFHLRGGASDAAGRRVVLVAGVTCGLARRCGWTVIGVAVVHVCACLWMLV